MVHRYSRSLVLIYFRVPQWGSVYFEMVTTAVEVAQAQVLHQAQVAGPRFEYRCCQARYLGRGLVGRSLRDLRFLGHSFRTLSLVRDLQSPWGRDQTRMRRHYSQHPSGRLLGDQIPCRTRIRSSGAEKETRDRLLCHGERALGGQDTPLHHLR